MARERILVALQGAEGDAAPIRAAAALAPAYDADIRGVFVEPDPGSYMMWTGPGAAGTAVVASALQAVRDETEKAAKAAEANFWNGLDEAGVEAAGSSFKRIADTPSDAAQQARLVRLLVACPQAVAGKGPLADFVTACLIEEGCPVFAARQGALPPRRLALAWDGSKEAAKAAFAAEPLLQPGAQAVILHSGRNLDHPDRAVAAPNRLANWLKARGLQPEDMAVDGGGPLGEAILKAAESCDLLVAGAYGHSRIAQFIFGGVTRTLTQAVDGPSLLTAH